MVGAEAGGRGLVYHSPPPLLGAGGTPIFFWGRDRGGRGVGQGVGMGYPSLGQGTEGWGYPRSD